MKFHKISQEQFDKDMGKYLITRDKIKLPKRSTKYSAGYDIFSVVDISLCPGDSILVPTGIKFECDDDKFLMIVPRSGHGFKHGIRLANSVGVIDKDYYNNPKNEGHIWIKIDYPKSSISNEMFSIKCGDAICQAIIMPYYKVEDDEADGERVGGFGSTDK